MLETHGCEDSMYMGSAMDGGLWVLTILMGNREPLAGIGHDLKQGGYSRWFRQAV